MDDDLLIGLLILLAIALPICAIVGMVLAISANNKAKTLQVQVSKLEVQLKNLIASASPAPEPEPRTLEPPAPVTAPVEEQVEVPRPKATVPKIAPPVVQPHGPAQSKPEPSKPGLEEKLGTRWAVWVGGIALALGGILMVRYSIEQNLLDAKVRIALGGVFALLLAGAGEWLRRRDGNMTLPGMSKANVPAILTAAGTSTAFATAFSAYALYDFIGPATTFVLLGLISVLTMIAAALHGPALAALGLVAALGSPLLVASGAPQPWALVIYLVFVVAPAYAVARVRRWRWLAIAAAVGALLWTFPISDMSSMNILPAWIHLVLQIGLAGIFLVIDPHRHRSGEDAQVDWLASGTLAAFAAASVLLSSAGMSAESRAIFSGIVTLMMLALGIRFTPAAPASAWAALVTLGTLVLWPIRREIGGDPENFFFQSGDEFALRPDALNTYVTFAILAPAMIAGASFLRVLKAPRLPFLATAFYVGTAVITPLLALVAAYWRVAEFERDISFALVAGALALAYTGLTAKLKPFDREDMPGIRLIVGAAASAALSALALGLTFALDQGMLTVAFALTALGTAWISEKVSIPALRYVVGAIGIIILGRLIWNPWIVTGDPGPGIFNWIMWGYGIPALCFALASRILAKSGRDWTTQLTESLTIVFAAALFFFEVRHTIHGTDPLDANVELVETGLYVIIGLSFGLVLSRFDVRRADPVYFIGSIAFKGISFLLSVMGLLISQNPLFTTDPVPGGVFINALLICYLIPAVLALATAYQDRQGRHKAYAILPAALGLALQFTYMILEIRRIFQGKVLSFWHATGQAEQWAYSIALLVVGILLLGFGLFRNVRLVRIISAVYLVAAVLKVFLFDLANLEGIMRALSFIGLGLVLIGIGLVYQRLLKQRPDGAASL